MAVSQSSVYQQIKKHFLLLLIFFIGVTLRVYMANLDPYLHTWDECFHALVAKNMINNPLKPMLLANPVADYDMGDWSHNHIWLHKQPLFLWQIALSMKLFGSSTLTLRLPSIIMGSLMIPMVYRICILLTRNEWTSITAAAFMSLSYYQLGLIAGIITTDQNDVAFGFYVLASIWSYTEYIHSGKWYWALLSGIFSGGAILNKWLTGLLVFSAWGIRLWFTRDKKQFFHLLVALTACVIVFLPWQLYIFAHYPKEAAFEFAYNTKHIWEAVEGHIADDWFYYHRFRTYFGFITWLLIIPGMIIMLLKRVDVYEKTIALSLACYTILTFVFFSFIVKTKMDSYFFVVGPLCFIFMAVALNHIAGLLKQPILRATLIAWACWYVLDLREIIDYKNTFQERPARIHNANVYKNLQQHLPPDVHIVATPECDHVELLFHNPQLMACRWDLQESALAALAKQKKRIAVFKNHDQYVMPERLAKYPYLYIIPEQIQLYR